MSLKQFALAVGAAPKWVLNARPRLGRAIEYSAADARWLRLARVLSRDLGIPLNRAGSLACRTLEARTPEAKTPGRRLTRMVANEVEGVRLTIDLQRFESTCAAALSAALAFGDRKRAGRKRRSPRHAGAAMAQALRLSIDSGLLRLRARRAAMSTCAATNRLTIARRQTNLSAELRIPHETARTAILQRLTANGVRFVLVGELAEIHAGATDVNAHEGHRCGIASTHGTPVLELCYADSAANARRLALALRAIGARPDIPTDSRCNEIEPRSTPAVDPITLRSAVAMSFATPHGTIHVRRVVAGIGEFNTALRRTLRVRTYGRELVVLELSALADARVASGTCCDIARLPVLETLMAVPAIEARRRELEARRIQSEPT